MIPESNPKTTRIGICNARMAHQDRRSAKSSYAPARHLNKLAPGGKGSELQRNVERQVGQQIEQRNGYQQVTLPCVLPEWALAGESWMDLIEQQAHAAGGLEALRERGLALR
ncbi:MAG: hypothetical protein BMS9Abin01_2397 [Gammaproteobacteria bacterium]|nr:MAG: hypothetical protein BMS9Abin01_2397 [Gammaproteobacteria bacterium]